MIKTLMAVAMMTGAFSAPATCQPHKMTPRYVANEELGNITFTKEENQNIEFRYLSDKIVENLVDQLENSYVIYNNDTYEYQEYLDDEGAEQIIWYSNETTDIFKYEVANYTFLYRTDGDDYPIDNNFTIYNANFIVQAMNESTITFTAFDLNNKTYTYLKNFLNNANEQTSINNLEDTQILYENTGYTYDEIILEDSLVWITSNKKINFFLDENGTFAYKNIINNEWAIRPFTEEMTIYNAKYIVDNISGTPTTGGIAEEITTDIKSGLTLISDLAVAFLQGFTSIFWNSATNTLTPFANFALIMLSIAIVFAVIKLVLNIVRSNTGV